MQTARRASCNGRLLDQVKLESKMSEYEKQTECHYLAKAPFIRAVKQASQRWSETRFLADHAGTYNSY